MKRGIPFSINRFYALGSVTAVQKTLSRLALKGDISRVDKGIYVRPKSLPRLPSITLKPSATSIAQVWAKRHNHTLVPQGMEAAYRLGFQTQAPVKTIFWTNGPSRRFVVGKEVVEVRHTARSKLRWNGRPEGELLRGLSVIPPSEVTLPTLYNAFKRLGLTDHDGLAALHRLKTLPLLKAWQQKFSELESWLATLTNS